MRLHTIALFLTAFVCSCAALDRNDAIYATLSPQAQAGIDSVGDRVTQAVKAALRGDLPEAVTAGVSAGIKAAETKKSNEVPKDFSWLNAGLSALLVALGLRTRHVPIVGGKPDPRVTPAP